MRLRLQLPPKHCVANLPERSNETEHTRAVTEVTVM